ncbi:MAG: Hsp20/alpha crystallin family protein, partial [Acidobacteria bacterium]|nr:Hsp20/alpha crystallin family protein [Acidobacteriota bacterium]
MRTGTRSCAPRGVVVIDPFNVREGGRKMPHRYNDWRDWRDYAGRVARLYEEAAPREERRARDGGGGDEFERADWTPASDVVERENEFVVLLDLPGINRDALDVSVSDGRLVVRGERAAEEGVKPRRGGRPAGRFLARFGPLPKTVDQSRIAAD